MECEVCHTTEVSDFIILPIKQPDGRLNTIVCLECAWNSSAYCQKHQNPHLGFLDDESTTCLLCIEEMVEQNRDNAFMILNVLEWHLPNEEFNSLIEWADLSGQIIGCSRVISILRALVTKALRHKMTIREVVEEIIQTKSVEAILPKII